MKPGAPSEGHWSAANLLAALRPLHGSVRPDVSLKPYRLSAHQFARIDTGFTREGGMAVSNANTMPLAQAASEAHS